MAEADFPYLVLQAAWKDAAAAGGRHRVHELRPRRRRARRPSSTPASATATGRPGPALVPANGVAAKITALPRAILLPESVQFAAASWTAVTRPTNLLLVFDTSGSMSGQVPGAGKTRLDLTKAAALNSLALLDDAAQVGVWEFSTARGGQDYRELLPLAPLERGRRATRPTARRVNAAVNGLEPGGNTGLYNTAWAACQEVSAQARGRRGQHRRPAHRRRRRQQRQRRPSLEQLLDNLQGHLRLQPRSRSRSSRSGSASTRTPTCCGRSPTPPTPRRSPRRPSFDINQVLLAALFS